MSSPTRQPRPWIIDVLAALACLAIAWWRTSTLRDQPVPIALILVSVVAALFGAGVGWWARSGQRRPIFVLTLLLVVVIVFVLLVGAPPQLAGTRWAWLLVAFAGAIIGSGIGERVMVARTSADKPKKGRSREGSR